jgi:hypothetical protein
MLDVKMERLRAHQKNIDRYRRLLATHLLDLERSFIQRRLSEEEASVKGLLREAFPDRLSAGSERIEGRTAPLEVSALLHPADAFEHPLDVVDDCDLTSYEKRAILSSWAADACAVPGPKEPVPDPAVSFEDILDALHLLESEPTPAVDRGKDSGRHEGHIGPDTLSLDF